MTRTNARAKDLQGETYSSKASNGSYKHFVGLADIPPRYLQAHLQRNCSLYADMDGKANAYRLAVAFAAEGFVMDRHANRFALFLCGLFGVGKTWLGTAILKNLIANHENRREYQEREIEPLTAKHHPIWIKFHTLVREVQACYNPAATTDTYSVIRRYQKAPLLLVDDIGDMEARGETEDRRRILYEIIDYRNDYMLPTIMTSNLDTDMMAQHYGERSFQRLLELCAFIEMKGDNLRENMPT